MDQARLEKLKKYCVELGLAEAQAQWRFLTGGRSNLSWEVQNKTPIVVKLYQTQNQSPLFANEPALEWACLKNLAPKQMVPKALYHGEWEGTKFLVQDYVQPAARDLNPSEVGRYLKKLHALSPPAILPERQQNWLSDIARQFGTSITQHNPPPKTVFLHGDPVPSNFIPTAKALIAIDWQCPAVGDPCDDIAIYLSPSMQSIYSGQSLSASEIHDFWGAYDDQELRGRYDAHKADYSSVIAAYLKKRGQPEDLRAATLEEQS